MKRLSIDELVQTYGLRNIVMGVIVAVMETIYIKDECNAALLQ